MHKLRQFRWISKRLDSKIIRQFYVYVLVYYLVKLSLQVFPITEKLYIGLTGLASDVLSVNQLLNFKCNLYKLRENREIKPEAFSAMLSSLLYEKR